MDNKLICAHVTTATATVQVVDGRSYLVAPVVAIKAGVMNTELIPAEEIQKSVQYWNDVPIPIDHPAHDDKMISAKDIGVIEKVVVGRFYNAYYEDEKLKGELWIDIEKAQKVGGDALKALEKLQNGEPLEVSTAYFSDVSSETGTYNGVEYEGIEYNLRPDHLALLPASIGACSWQDGCGAPRVNKEDEAHSAAANQRASEAHIGAEGRATGADKEGETMPQLRVALREGESYEMRSESVERAIKAAVIPDGSEGWYVYIYDLFEDFAVYSVTIPDQESSFFRVPYTVASDLEVSLGDAIEVKRKVEYIILKANIRGAARKPSYVGTESTTWTGPTLKKMIAGYVKHTGNSKPESSLVKDLPAGAKSWIASKTLLGDAKADNERDLTFFPCVNPGTNKLSERGLKAILGGRGAQADIPASARDSARAKARSLLEKEFGMKTEEDKLVGKVLTRIKELLGVKTMSDKEKMLETLRTSGVEIEGLENAEEGILKWMVEHNVAPIVELTPTPDAEGFALIPGEPMVKPEVEPVPQVNEGTDVTINEYLKGKGIDLERVLEYMKTQEAAVDKTKQDLVALLVSNEKCAIDKEALDKMETGVLKQLSAAYEPGSYLGVGVSYKDSELIPDPPAVVLAERGE